METYWGLSEFHLQLLKESSKDYSLGLPEDISETVHKFFPWKTAHDVNYAEFYYLDELYYQSGRIDIHAELSKLEDFSAVLGRLRDSCLEVCLADEKRLAQPFYALVEQVPSIKEDPYYEYLTTDLEKCEIEKALKQKTWKEQIQATLCSQIQVTQQSLSGHLEVLRRELQNIDNGKIMEAHRRMSSVNFLRNRVNRMIETLKNAVINQRMLKDEETIRKSIMTRSKGVTNKFPGFSRL